MSSPHARAGGDDDRTRAEALFVRALDMSAGDRARLLDRECPDAALRAEVEALLDAEASGGEWLAGVAARAGSLLEGDDGQASDDSGSMAGRVAGPYRIDRLLGRGGMGEVYLGHDPRLDRPVALKFLPPHMHLDPRAGERFREEARAASALEHPNVGTVYDIGEAEDGRVFIAMAYYDGETLRERLVRGALPADEARDIATQLARGLGAAHAAGIVHRDLKPGNVIFTRDGLAKIVDFGIAKISGQALTRTGSTLGTIAYMSPEQTEGDEVDARSDLWSLGVVLYEMLLGRRPFGGTDDRAMVVAIRHSDVRDIDDLGARGGDLSSVVLRCLEKDADDRYPDAGSLIADLESGAAPPEPARARRGWIGVAAAIVGAAAIGLATIIGSWNGNPVDGPGAASRTSVETPRPALPRVAVLPFSNDAGDPELGIFADGVTDRILHRLERLDGVEIVVSGSVAEAAAVGLGELARVVGVSAVVTGSVGGADGDREARVRIVDPSSGEEVGNSVYSDGSGTLDEFESEVAGLLTRALDLPDPSPARGPVVDREAQTLVFRARYLWSGRTRDGFTEAETLLRRALEIDAEYAEAWSALGDVYVSMTSYGMLTPEVGFPRAQEAVERALALDPELVEAHTTLGDLMMDYYWDFDAAEEHFQAALEAAPGYVVARYWYAQLLAHQARFEEARVQSRRAQELDPLNTLAVADEGRAYYQERDFERALEVFEQVNARAPNFVAGLYSALSLVALGEHQAAITAFRRFRGSFSRAPEWALVTIPLMRLGLEDEARRELEQAEAAAESGAVPEMVLVAAYAAVGETDAAFDWLERAVAARNWQVSFLATEPLFDPLRGDPRFDAILEEVGFSIRLRDWSRRHASER